MTAGRASVAPRTLALSGLWVAGIGFFVTRFTVTLAAYETRTQFLLVGVVPLIVGLLLAAVGVAFVVGSFDPGFVRTVAIWCTAGTLAMAVMVVLTLSGSSAGVFEARETVRSATILSNFLIGGAVLGALTGLYAGRNARTRKKLRQQANQLVTINRILRHEVLNSVAVIRGRAELFEGDGQDRETVDHILREADNIVDTIDNVKQVSRTARSSTDGLVPVDLGAAVQASLAIAEERYPNVAFSFDDQQVPDVTVWADRQLSHALYPLVENAAVHNDADEPEVTVELAVGRDVACVRIVDTGSGLPPEHRATLERGEIPDYDDPSAGFGTNIARMYIDGYGGDIRTDVTAEGTTVEVLLRSASRTRSSRRDARTLQSVGVDRSMLLVAASAAIVAGGAMGIFMQVTAGIIPIIGALYGVTDPIVGWITHEFHSVVFGFVFAGLLTLLPPAYEDRLAGRLGVGVAWGLFLWLVAAGVVMPIWLNLVGIPATLPSVSITGFQSHLLWGVVLGLGYHLVVEYLVQRSDE